MALRGGRGRKEMKKSSYYVWFLGAQECRGLRGEEYIRPVVRYFMEQEREMEPMKVTLQVSGKGLKIIQSCGVSPTGDAPRHFIPHYAITCVVQECHPNADIVSAILLIYNPLTKCPVHVHSYRCDSPETASILRYQLSQLIEREENQRKLEEIESRLEAKGLLMPRNGSIPRAGSDGRSTRDSESSGSWDRDRIANLYDSVAAELREKLGKKMGEAPLLLPPRDYDTMTRQQGKLEGIDERRSRQANIVGVGGRKSTSMTRAAITRDDSSGKSSGIGSDEASSPLHDRDFRTSRDLDARSSSDEEWEVQGEPRAFTEDSLFLVQPRWGDVRGGKRREDGNPLNRQHSQSKDQLAHRHLSPPRDPRWSPAHLRKKNAEERQRSPSPSSPRQSFAAAREKFRMMERKQEEDKKHKVEIKRQPSKAKEDTSWPKSDKDTGYISKDGFGTRDTGYGSKSGRSTDLSPTHRGKSKETEISPSRGNRPQREESAKKNDYRSDFARRKSFSKEHDNVRSNNMKSHYNNNNNGSLSSSCNSIDLSYDCRYRSSDALDNFDRCPSSRNPVYRDYRQNQSHLLPKNKSFDNLDNRRRHEEIRRNKSFDELEYERRTGDFDARMRAYPRATRYRSQEEVNVRKRDDDAIRRREEEMMRRREEEMMMMRRRENEAMRRENDGLRRIDDYHRRQVPEDRVTHQAINRHVNKDRLKRHSTCYTELDDSLRYPGLDKDSARLQHHSLQHLPIARGPIGGPAGPVGPGTRPSYERSQSELPPQWHHRHAFGRYSYAEPSSYHRAQHIGVGSGY